MRKSVLCLHQVIIQAFTKGQGPPQHTQSSQDFNSMLLKPNLLLAESCVLVQQNTEELLRQIVGIRKKKKSNFLASLIQLILMYEQLRNQTLKLLPILLLESCQRSQGKNGKQMASWN